ncbi:hypothetical protein ASG52_08485 [Methylobacterium sp. Leaf456]|uniref:O-antigen ligase family protein n=1 Tax=Methylobacterium sp. Leaf456 TaxID=1736382 RepID=UPI0006F7BE28|nr:O-antigen ligase family protein [Methylobacterium sp. Leaf456]KQT50092.1 hypothetical protein ASG52_08485 [Methylobacterium sp. Leaf456]
MQAAGLTPHRDWIWLPAATAVAIVAAVALLVIGLSATEGESLPPVIMLAALPLPILLFVGTQTLAWNQSYAFYGAILVIILQCANLRVREIEDKTIDFQILIKLACVGSMLTLALAAMVRRWPLRESSEALLWFAFFAYLIVTSANSVQPTLSFVETVSNIAAFLYVYSLVRFLGVRNATGILITACFVLCIVSIAAYFLNPLLGRMSDWVNGAFIPTSRLTGVFGTANAAGAAAAIGIMLTVLFSGLSLRRPLFYVLIAPMAFCLLVSNNRMSVAAMMAGLLYVYAMRGRFGIKFALGLLVAALGVLVMASFGDSIMSGLSRSGSADEITSGTGRTRIWAVVIELWMEQPLFGYGAGSAKFILPFHPMLFKAAAHAHNMYLNILFSGGLIGLSIFLTSLVLTLRRAWSARAHNVIGIVIFYLLYGITEPTIGGLVSFLSLSFYALPCLALAAQASAGRPREATRAIAPFRYVPYRP